MLYISGLTGLLEVAYKKTMSNFNNTPTSKIISLAIAVSFLMADISYAEAYQQGSLRVPVGEGYTYKLALDAAEGKGTPASGSTAPTSWSRAGRLPDEIKEGGGYLRNNEGRLEKVDTETLRNAASNAIKNKANGAQVFLQFAGENREFTLRKITVLDKTFDLLIDTGARSAGDIGALLEKALAGFPQLDVSKPYIILSVDHIADKDVAINRQDHLAGDCIKNGIILLHNNLNNEIQKLNQATPEGAPTKFGDILLEALLTHELRHEATGEQGRDAEESFLKLDCSKLIELCGRNKLNCQDVIEAWVNAGVTPLKGRVEFEKQITMAALLNDENSAWYAEGIFTPEQTQDIARGGGIG